MSRTLAISVINLFLVIGSLMSTSALEDNDLVYQCPTEDFRYVTCLPPALRILKDNVSVGNEDALAFEALGGKILSSCNTVVIKIVDLRLSPVPQTCDDTLDLYRIFEIYDGDPTDPQILPKKCTITYKSVISFNLAKVNNTPPETVVSCEDDIESALQDYIDNYGYQEFFSCTNVRLKPGGMTPSVPSGSFQYSCENNGFVRIQFTLIDDCGYELNTINNFRVVDDKAPSFTFCPLDLTLDLSEDNIEDKITALLNAAEAVDNCGVATVNANLNLDEIDISSCDQQQEYPIIYTASDECNNSVSNCSAKLTLTNFSEPEITCPDTLTIECKDPMDSLLVGNWIANVQALDFKKDVIVREFIDNNFNEAWLEQTYCDDGFDVTFTATDPCGVKKSCLSHVGFLDRLQPEIINCPADTTLLADDPDKVLNISKWLLSFESMDQCNASISTRNDFDFDDLDFECGDREIIVHFLADDQCNPIDSNLCKSTITILDNVVSDFLISR